jgi:hypothetical protein
LMLTADGEDELGNQNIKAEIVRKRVGDIFAAIEDMSCLLIKEL